MSDGAGLGVVERARSAASRGDWQQAFGLLVEADTNVRRVRFELEGTDT